MGTVDKFVETFEVERISASDRMGRADAGPLLIRKIFENIHLNQ
jgi:hypothetical protein